MTVLLACGKVAVQKPVMRAANKSITASQGEFRTGEERVSQATLPGVGCGSPPQCQALPPSHLILLTHNCVTGSCTLGSDHCAGLFQSPALHFAGSPAGT